MKPILLRGHERPLTKVKYNREGDLIFTCAKDNVPTVWYSDNGERLGTYKGHEGAVTWCDVSWDSSMLMTSSADRTVRLWQVETGLELKRFDHKAAVRCAQFSQGENMLMTVQDNNFNQRATIFLYKLEADLRDQTTIPLTQYRLPDSESKAKMTVGLWGELNQAIYTSTDDGAISKWDAETGDILETVRDHKARINDLQMSKDKSMIISASSDMTAKVYDAKTLTLLKTFQSDRPINSAAFAPHYNQVIIGGGQDAMSVTTTVAKAGHFEVDFFNLVYQEFLCSVKGHFGPVNSLAFHPNGTSFVSGGEDGYVRLHNFDKGYFSQSQKYQW